MPSPIPPLTQDELAIIDATVPILRERGTDVTSVFYSNLLSDVPALSNVFNLTNQKSGRQPAALAHALFLYATHIRDPTSLQTYVETVCQKHASLGVQREQYAVVGSYLLAAFRQVLGQGVFTPAVEEAWLHAYQHLASIMAGREKELYQQSASWEGYRQMRIAKKVQESDDVVSFHLEPADSDRLAPGQDLPAFEAGQYVTVRVVVDHETGLMQTRQYSLSMATKPTSLRISPKLVPDNSSSKADGRAVSRVLHLEKQVGDLIEVTFPRGDFVLPTAISDTTPLILLSAGIGITPLLSMLQDKRLARSTLHFIHVTKGTKTHAFRTEVLAAIRANPSSKATFYYTDAQEAQSGSANPRKDDERISYKVGRPSFFNAGDESSDTKGLALHDSNTLYFVCGPEPFMSSVRAQLMTLGVGDGRIRSEVFNVAT